MKDPSRDPFTFANLDAFRTTHIELDLSVDFERRVLQGFVILHLDWLDSDARSVILDSRGLQIAAVQFIDSEERGKSLDFRLGPLDPVRGQALGIPLPKNAGHVQSFRLKIDYQTGPEASALMWLPPELTAGGEQPFLFTQSQSIHARSWVPLQDSPSLRFTYQARIRTPPGLLALMSAENQPGAASTGDYYFNMTQPIPSYLLALAVGELDFAGLGRNTGVYAEPEVLPAAAAEFADTQNMLDRAEQLYGPYRWGRYDLLILPPSFPFGGMENPRLSFITPSIIAGDGSLVSMIAHELAHSWSGNLVSNRSWRDIWLNEGTTSYLDTRLMEALYGKERADEERLLMYGLVEQSIAESAPQMQALAPLLEMDDPDEAPYGIKYGKGQFLLEHLEAVFGREVFDRFLESYFDHFAFQAIGSEAFLEYLDTHLLKNHPGIYSREEIEAWLYGAGVPDALTLPESASLTEAASLAAAWSKGEIGATALPAERWSPQAMVRFLEKLPPDMNHERLDELDALLGLSISGNSEITRSWFIQVAKWRYLAAYPAMEAYLHRYGRTRLIKPVYSELVQNGVDGARAASIFSTAKPNYHPLTIASIERILSPKG